MYDITNVEMIFRLVLSTILGGAIGFEREVGNRPAGLRTHILVTVGSALIMLLSKYGFADNSDPARIAAQVVSGIGFLGAGTILRTGNTVQGLTTAATLWLCAGLGLAIGAGFYLAAIVTTILVLLSLVILVRIEDSLLSNSKKRRFTIVARERAGLIGDIGSFFGKNNLVIKKVDINPMDGQIKNVEINFLVEIQSDESLENLIDLMYNIEGIEKISLD